MLSAFTLNELPNESARLDTLLTLWKKCDGYFVLVENGTNAGFKLIEEARDFLMAQAKQDQSAYLFAPCPHELPCPRAVKNDGTPCNFAVKYRSLDIGQNIKDQIALYSHVIFKKGLRTDDKTIDWPRMVRPTQVRSRHTRCKLCTHRGKLEEVVITKRKHSKYDNTILFSIIHLGKIVFFSHCFVFQFVSLDTLTVVREKAIGAIECQLNSMRMSAIQPTNQIFLMTTLRFDTRYNINSN